jgi:hypothetical protein
MGGDERVEVRRLLPLEQNVDVDTDRANGNLSSECGSEQVHHTRRTRGIAAVLFVRIERK